MESQTTITMWSPVLKLDYIRGVDYGTMHNVQSSTNGSVRFVLVNLVFCLYESQDFFFLMSGTFTENKLTFYSSVMQH